MMMEETLPLPDLPELTPDLSRDQGFLISKAESILKGLITKMQMRSNEEVEKKTVLTERLETMQRELEAKKNELKEHEEVMTVEDLKEKIETAEKDVELKKEELKQIEVEFGIGVNTIKQLKEENERLNNAFSSANTKVEKLKSDLMTLQSENTGAEEVFERFKSVSESLESQERLSNCKVISCNEGAITLEISFDQAYPPLCLQLKLDGNVVTDVVAKVCDDDFDFDRQVIDRLRKPNHISKVVLYFKDMYYKQFAFRKELKDLGTRFAIDWITTESALSVIIPSALNTLTMVKLKIDPIGSKETISIIHAEGPKADQIHMKWREYTSITDCLEHLHEVGMTTD